MTESNKNIKAYFAWMAICIIWGTTYLAIKIGVTDLPPMLFAGLRWIAASLILFVFFKIKKYPFPDKKYIKHIAVVGLLLIGCANGLVVFAEMYISSGLASLLITTMPFWLVGFESIITKGKKINITIIGGLVLGFAGVFIIFGIDQKSLLEGTSIWGILGLMGAVIIWSIGTLYSKYVEIKSIPIVSAGIQMLIAGIAQTILGTFLGEWDSFVFTQDSFYAFTYLIVFGSIFGYGSYIYAIEHLPVSFVATYAYINPIIALFLGWLVLSETITWPIALGAVVILIGVSLVKKGNKT